MIYIICITILFYLNNYTCRLEEEKDVINNEEDA